MSILILLTAITILVMSITIPSLQKIFNFEFPGYKHFEFSILGACSILLILELIKYFNLKKSEKFVNL